MEKFYITFKRYNNQDVEAAEENFPCDDQETALERQFKCEWTSADPDHSLGILVHELLHPNENIMVVHATAKAPDIQTLVEDIQEVLFEEGGMSGFFSVAENEYPDYNNV